LRAKIRAWKSCGEGDMQASVRRRSSISSAIPRRAAGAPALALALLAGAAGLALALVVPAACNTTTTNNAFGDAGHCGDGDGGSPPPPQACADLVDALARANVRCHGDAGPDYATTYQTLLTKLAGGDCNSVTGIKDEPALCERCIPSLATIACADILDERLPGTCNLQLERLR
jgi:hypothetical protein